MTADNVSEKRNHYNLSSANLPYAVDTDPIHPYQQPEPSKPMNVSPRSRENALSLQKQSQHLKIFFARHLMPWGLQVG